MAAEQTRSILFIEKVFLGRRRGAVLRGVELFNLALIDDLTALGFSVTVISSRDYQELWDARPRRSSISVAYLSRIGGKLLAPALTTLRLRGPRFESIILGNVGDTVILPALIAWIRRLGASFTLIAHRVPPAFFIRALKPVQPRVVAVNRIIAEIFTRAGYREVGVYYGVTNGESFSPDVSSTPKDCVHFLLLGMLDNAWKGADTAIEAFCGLPAQIRSRARLHLASYLNGTPELSDPNIVIHPWAPPDRMPEFIRGMDVLLVPSRDEEIMRETFSQAMVQGMLSGLPVLASDLPVLSEKLDQGGGMIFHTTAELRAQMTQLIEDAELRRRLGREARRTAVERYLWNTETFVSRYLLSEPKICG